MPNTQIALKWYADNVFTLRGWVDREVGLPFQNMMALISQSQILTRQAVCETKVLPKGFQALRNKANYITKLAEGETELTKDEFGKVMLFSQYARREQGHILEIGQSWLMVLKDYQISNTGFMFTKRAEWKISEVSEATTATGNAVWDVLCDRAKEPAQVIAAAAAMSSKINPNELSWVDVFEGVTTDNLIDKILPVKDVTSGNVASLVSVLTVCAFAELDHAGLAELIKDYGRIQCKEAIRMSALPTFRTPDNTQTLQMSRNGVKLSVAKVEELPDECVVPLSNVRFTHSSVELLSSPHYRVFHTTQPLTELWNQVGKGQFQRILDVSYVKGATVKFLANKIRPEVVGDKPQAAGAASINNPEDGAPNWGD